MYLAIIILPLLGSIASGFFGRKVGFSGSQIITCTAVIMTTVFAVVAFFEVGLNNIPVSMELFRWIDSESLYVSWAFHFDSLTVSMLIPVLIVSSLVHIYSIGYMGNDPHNQRFFSYLSLFTFMMLILVTANSYLLMFVGWEGVGVCSYLLVCFWPTRIPANQSSLSAFLTNRVGDCFLTIGMFAILWAFGNLDYATVFSLAPYMHENVVTIVGICLLIGAMAKSSQVGLHLWLPMAMEGPTPVSALIHAATMVTAGVYLLMRSSPLIEYSSMVLMLCLWLGAITTVFSSLIGLFQQDIKKVIAYSTMSQLGMMVIAVGLSCYGIALFHLVNHAFYKALLFLGAGAVIHAVADNQDFRRYGGLRTFLPLTYSVMLIASLSLVAFPFMTGFYSKDFILESAYGHYYFSGTVVYIIATIGAMFTTLYSVKVLYLTFLTNPNGPLINYKNAHEGDIFMSSPLMILAVFSIFFGFVSKDMFIGLGSGFFSDNALFIHPSHEIMLDTEFGVPTLFKLLPLFFTISLSVIAIILSEFLSTILIYFKLSRAGYNIFSFFNLRFLIELFYNRYITGFVLKLGGQTTKNIDKGSVEYLGPYGLEKGLLNISNNIASLNTGSVTTYALYITTSIVFYMLFSSYIASSILILSILLATCLVLYSTNQHFSSTIKSSFNNGVCSPFVLILFSTTFALIYLQLIGSLAIQDLYHGVLNYIIAVGDFSEFFTPSFSLNTEKGSFPPTVRHLNGEIYVDGTGTTGKSEVDNCPEQQAGVHRIGESRPKDLLPTDNQTAECGDCERTIKAVKEFYNTCINCDMSLCGSCYPTFFEQSSNSIIPLLVIGDFPVVVLFSTIARLLLDPFHRAVLFSGFRGYKLKWSPITMFILFIILTVVLTILSAFVLDGLYAAFILLVSLYSMRAVFKYRYAGSLKNIRSSHSNEPSTMLRGYCKSNSQESLINAKTRNGTFGLKTWLSSHDFLLALLYDLWTYFTVCFYIISSLAIIVVPSQKKGKYINHRVTFRDIVSRVIDTLIVLSCGFFVFKTLDYIDVVSCPSESVLEGSEHDIYQVTYKSGSDLIGFYNYLNELQANYEEFAAPLSDAASRARATFTFTGGNQYIGGESTVIRFLRLTGNIPLNISNTYCPGGSSGECHVFEPRANEHFSQVNPHQGTPNGNISDAVNPSHPSVNGTPQVPTEPTCPQPACRTPVATISACVRCTLKCCHSCM